MANYSQETLDWINQNFPHPSAQEMVGRISQVTVSPFDEEAVARYTRIRAELMTAAAEEAQAEAQPAETPAPETPATEPAAEQTTEQQYNG